MTRLSHQVLRRTIWGVSLGVLLVLPACGGSEDIEDGARTYERGCYSCHGPVGLGDGPTAKLMGIQPANLQQVVQEKPKSEVLDTIARGRKAMPAFRHTLTDAEREAVYRYLLTLPEKKVKVSRGLDPTGFQGLR